MSKRVYIIDGAKFSSFDEFTRYFSDVVFKGYQWHGNLDAFDDMLWGGFGTPLDGYFIRWENSGLSRRNLGYSETVRWLEGHVTTCDPSGTANFQRRLEQAKAERGETLFDTIIEIIRDVSEKRGDLIELELL